MLVGIVTLPKGSIEKRNTCRVLALLGGTLVREGYVQQKLSQFSQIVTPFYFESYENHF